jgi:type II secretory pathway component GspD/PulD (secretin)
VLAAVGLAASVLRLAAAGLAASVLQLAAVGLAASLLLLAAATAAQERAVEVYRPAHRPAAELLGVARTALAGDGSAALDAASNALVLMGPRARVDEALAVLRALDRPQRSVVIHFASRGEEELAKAGIAIDWRAGPRALRVGDVRLPPGAEGVRLRADLERGAGHGSFEGRVRVLDGEVARIGAGSSVPLRTGPFVTRAEAERGFWARPRVLEDGRVRLLISPTQGEVDARGRVRFVEAASVVVLRPGETVALGALSQTGSARELGTGGASAEERRQQTVLLVRVELAEP